MAIQNRRGNYTNFDPEKMLPGEWGVALGGDPNAADGKSVYMCFEAGNVKRMATYEDMKENIRQSSGEVIAAEIETATGEAVRACEAAAEKAGNDTAAAVQNANAAASDAAAAADSANAAAENATAKADQATADIAAAIARSDESAGNADAAADRANAAAQVVDDALAGVGYTDISDKTVTFEENSSHEIASGETAAVLFGKIEKFMNTVEAKAPGFLTHGWVPIADRLFRAWKIDGVEFQGTSDISHFGICYTSGSTGVKSVMISGMTGNVANTGARVIIRFTEKNAASNPSLKVNDTMRGPIYYGADPIPADYIEAGMVLEFVFDGAYWRVVGELTQAQVDDLKTRTANSALETLGSKNGLTARYKYNGMMASVYITGDFSGTLAAWGTLSLGTLPAAARPPQKIYVRAIDNYSFEILTNGMVQLRNASNNSVSPSGYGIEGVATYLL